MRISRTTLWPRCRRDCSSWRNSSVNSFSCFLQQKLSHSQFWCILCSRRVRKIDQFEVNPWDVFIQINKSEVSKSSQWNNIHLGVLEELKYEIAELLAMMWNTRTKSYCIGVWVYSHLQNCQLPSTKRLWMDPKSYSRWTLASFLA